MPCLTRPSWRSLRGRGRRSPFRGERRRVRWGASSSRILQFDVVIPGSRGQIFQLREHGWRIQGGEGGALGGSKTPQAGHPERQAFLSLGSGGGKSTFKVPVVQCPRRSLPDSQKATFRLSPHVAESELWSPCHGGLTLRTSPGPRHPRRPVCTHRRPGARASVCAGVGRPRQCRRVCFASRESGASQVTGP